MFYRESKNWTYSALWESSSMWPTKPVDDTYYYYVWNKLKKSHKIHKHRETVQIHSNCAQILETYLMNSSYQRQWFSVSPER